MGRRLSFRHQRVPRRPIIEACVDTRRPLELPPRNDIVYQAASSIHQAEGTTLSRSRIAHKVGESYILDVLRGRYPPFDPQAVVEEFAALLKAYKLASVVGDNYSAAWAETAVHQGRHSLRAQRAEQDPALLGSAAALHALRHQHPRPCRSCMREFACSNGARPAKARTSSTMAATAATITPTRLSVRSTPA